MRYFLKIFRTIFRTISLAIFSTWPLLVLTGCSPGSEQITAPQPEAPVLLPLATYVAGTSHEVIWEPGPDNARFQIQRSGTPDFSDALVEGDCLVESDWVTGHSWLSTDLAHGQTYHYRLRMELPDGRRSGFSASLSTTVDAMAPVAMIDPLETSQTSLMFTLSGTASDQGSGVSQIRLLYLPPGGAWTEAGVYPGFPITFTTEQSGTFTFKAVATDLAGNIQDESQAIERVTQVPEPIFITDLTGEQFDITNAVLRYNIAVSGWMHGLGRFRIPPIIDPEFLNPGDNGFPDPENLADIMGVNFGGEQRAYPIGELANREVVDDEVAGVHLAATY